MPFWLSCGFIFRIVKKSVQWRSKLVRNFWIWERTSSYGVVCQLGLTNIELGVQCLDVVSLLVGIIVALPFRWGSFQFPSVFFCVKELMLIGIIGVTWMSLLAVGKYNCELDIQFNLELMILVSLLGTDSAGVLEGLEGCSPVLSFHFGLDRKYSNISIRFVFCLI